MALDSVLYNKIPKPVLLIILDGWGLSPNWGGNAISMNNPSNINKYWRNYQHTILQAFKPVAGDIGIVANSEIGHASIGTGRLVEPDINDINTTIKNKSFFQNQVLLDACQNVIDNNSSLHFIGLASDGAVHSYINHLYALLEMAKIKKINKVFIHIITDGRDVPSTSAIKYITDVQNKISELGVGQIASIVGRHYAMDRNGAWDRIEIAYKAQVYGEGRKESSPLEAVSHVYRDGFTDEFFPPTVITKNGKAIGKINDKDSVIFFNTRADRARELTRAYCDPKVFRSFVGRKYKLLKIFFATFTDYKLELPHVEILFPSAKIDSNLAKILSNHNYKQLHVAESEKYAHITYFFNGGYEEPFNNEDRIIVKSPKSISYAQNPEMSAEELTKKTLSAIKSKKYDFIVINYANVDMIGHTGNILAASKAVEIVDKNVAKLVDETLKQDGVVMITADHGNAEQMVSVQANNLDRETLHTLNPVPFIFISKNQSKNLIKSASEPKRLLLSEIITSSNTLADVAPTILEIFKIAKPTDMTGKSLLNRLQ